MVKTTERFSGAAGRNFTKLKVKLKVVKLSLQDKFVLEFRKVAPFLHKGRRQTSAVVLRLKFNRGYEIETA